MSRPAPSCVARHQLSLVKLAQKMELKFRRGLTLGCRARRLERALLNDGICESFHGIDVSTDAVKTAQETAAREALPLTYEVGDLNFIE
ncbi:MAG: class I SAM-dependent methyltransferase [Chthoniobacterales bacterium]